MAKGGVGKGRMGVGGRLKRAVAAIGSSVEEGEVDRAKNSPPDGLFSKAHTVPAH